MYKYTFKSHPYIILHRKMFGGRIFFDAIRDAYGKSEQNDKNAWIMGLTLSLYFCSFFFLTKLASIYAGKVCVIYTNLPACTLVSFYLFIYFFTKLTSVCTGIVFGILFFGRRKWCLKGEDGFVSRDIFKRWHWIAL